MTPTPLGAIGPGFATDILRLRPEDFFFVMGPAGLGAVMGILFLNAYGKGIPRRLLIDLGLVAMGVTLMGLALVKPVTGWLATSTGGRPWDASSATLRTASGCLSSTPPRDAPVKL